MKDIVTKKGINSKYYIESCATSTEELGNDMYYLAKEKLTEKGIKFTSRKARRITKEDYEKFDYIIGMDEENRRNIRKIIGDDSSKKVSLLLDYTDHPHSIADPWYNRDFETTYKEIETGVNAFLHSLE